MPQPSMAVMDASQFPRTRISAIQNNVRSLLRNPVPSSVYSRSANASAAATPRVHPVPCLPPLAFLRGQTAIVDEEARPVLQTVDSHNRGDPFEPPTPDLIDSSSSSPLDDASLWPNHLHPNHAMMPDTTARHEVGTIQDEEPSEAMDAYSTNAFSVLEDQDATQRTGRKRRRRNCKHCQKGRGAWFKHRHHRQNLWRGRTKVKAVGAVMSGIMLIVLLAAYLSLALTQPGLGIEIHVMFIISILGATIFFAHCAIRLCMLARRGRARRHHRGRFRHMPGPDGFHPSTPVRVHVAADEVALADGSDDDRDLEAQTARTEKVPKVVKVPPPAYGLWRSSVRINPNLLHWARVEQPPTPKDPFRTPLPSPSVAENSELNHSEPALQAPRPPSYVSDDGVTYIVDAQPRSTLLMPSLRPPSALHPAMRTDIREADTRSDDGTGTIAIGLGFDEHTR